MADRLLTREQLLDALTAAGGDSDVFVPVTENGRVHFRKMSEGSEADLGPGISTRSPKDFFFPPSEVMLRYERTGRGMELQAIAPAPEQIMTNGMEKKKVHNANNNVSPSCHA